MLLDISVMRMFGRSSPQDGGAGACGDLGAISSPAALEPVSQCVGRESWAGFVTGSMALVLLIFTLLVFEAIFEF
jgi:hypothetical protein